MAKKFTAEKFTCLPASMKFGRGILVLDETTIDMVPAGLKGVKAIVFNEKPSFISPDFEGCIIYSGISGQTIMNEEEIKQAKANYKANKKIIEKPCYVQQDGGVLSISSLPKNMNIVLKPYDGYYLDLTQTDIVEKQTIKGFRDVILYPKRCSVSKTKEPQKISSHEESKLQQVNQRIY